MSCLCVKLDQLMVSYQGVELRATNSLFQAAQQDQVFKTADAVVLVTIEDVNDNPPVFSQPSYNISILENLPDGMNVLQVTATDRDEVRRRYFGCYECCAPEIPQKMHLHYNATGDGANLLWFAQGPKRESAEAQSQHEAAVTLSPHDRFLPCCLLRSLKIKCSHLENKKKTS